MTHLNIPADAREKVKQIPCMPALRRALGVPEDYVWDSYIVTDGESISLSYRFGPPREDS